MADKKNEKVIEPICLHCKHLMVYPFCEAFTGKIPIEIRLGKNNHTKPYPSDNGIKFEPIEKEK